MQFKKSNIDVVDKVLTACYTFYQQRDAMLVSLLQQYEERGFLTKAQLQGLVYKAEKVPNFPAGLLATLQANIAKIPTKEKKNAPIKINNEPEKDEETARLLTKIITAYPQHKAAVGLLNNYTKFGKLSPTQKQELQKIYNLLVDRKML